MRIWELGQGQTADEATAYLKTYSGRTIRNIFWSANNYTLRRIRLKRTAASHIGTARRKRRHGAAIFALSRDIFRRWSFMKFQRWITPSL